MRRAQSKILFRGFAPPLMLSSFVEPDEARAEPYVDDLTFDLLRADIDWAPLKARAGGDGNSHARTSSRASPCCV
jgi:hypothetical protein